MNLLDFLFVILRGYFFSVLIETPILVLGLSPRHSLRDKIYAGFWLTAVSYPIVALVIPCLIDAVNNRLAYIVVSEVFAPVSECVVFLWVFGSKEYFNKKPMYRDLAAIIIANVCSFGVGQCL